VDVRAPAVGGAALANDQAGGLEGVEQRCECGLRNVQLPGQVALQLTFHFPDLTQQEVLRHGDAVLRDPCRRHAQHQARRIAQEISDALAPIGIEAPGGGHGSARR